MRWVRVKEEGIGMGGGRKVLNKRTLVGNLLS